jgi:hypothetical protein
VESSPLPELSELTTHIYSSDAMSAREEWEKIAIRRDTEERKNEEVTTPIT